MVAGKSDIINIKPNFEPDFNCCYCQSNELSINQIIFQGIHVLADCSCKHCDKEFYHTLPIAHDLLFPSCFDKQGRLLSSKSEKWLTKPLVANMSNPVHIDIQKEVLKSSGQAIILNCLDDCFGHVFTKLWNAKILIQKYPEYSIVLFIPQHMRWLVPEGLGEIWTFDAPWSVMRQYMENLNDEAGQLINKFDGVFLSRCYTHLSLDKVNLQAMLPVRPFDLSLFNQNKPTITFILREDRFWHHYPIEFFLFKFFFKLGLSGKLFCWRQNYLINKTVKKIRKVIDHVEFVATGIGTTGSLSAYVRDERRDKMAGKDELLWCNLYSQSHLVVGVHGSGMLIPTALAGGFIEVLPRHKIRHIAEDTLLNYSSRYTTFLGRHVDHFASPKLISLHATSIIKDFSYIYRNSEQKTD